MQKSTKILIVAIAVVLIGGVCALVATGKQPITQKVIETADEVTITFTEQGVKQRVTEVRIDGYAKDIEASITYHLINNTGYDIEPSIIRVFNVEPERYSVIEGQGYVAVPEYYQDFVDMPNFGTLLDGYDARYKLKLKVPGSYTDEVPEKWVFQTVARSGTGGMYQVASALWWIVNMR